MRQHGVEIEPGMTRDARDVLENGAARGVELDALVFGVARHAMSGGEHEIARDRGGGARIAARADDQHRALRDFARGRRGAAHHGGGRGVHEGKPGENAEAAHGRALSLLRRDLSISAAAEVIAAQRIGRLAVSGSSGEPSVRDISTSQSR